MELQHQPPISVTPVKNIDKFGWYLFGIALAVELLTPFLIWKGGFPSAVRWVTDAAVAGMLLFAYFRMMAFDRIPRPIILVIGVSLIGVTVAFFHGQSPFATVWGWWVMFRYVMVAFFAFLQPIWPDNFANRMRKYLVYILAFEVVAQALQFVGGIPPGDSLAGSFGERGVGALMTFTILVICISFGNWLVTEEWKELVFVLILGAISSGVAENKLYPFAAIMVGVVAIILFSFRYGYLKHLGRILLYIFLLIGVLFVFVRAYDTFVPKAKPYTFSTFFEADNLMWYLNNVQEGSSGRYGGYSGRSHLGRNFAIQYGWETINQDVVTLFLGMGLGARGESQSLGFAGQGLLQSDFGLVTGTSLLVIMQETGLLGMSLFAGFMIVTILALYRDIKRYPDSDVAQLRYALIIFTILWPIWLWYKRPWINSVGMLLYWITIGYVFCETAKTIDRDSLVNKLNRKDTQNQPVSR